MLVLPYLNQLLAKYEKNYFVLSQIANVLESQFALIRHCVTIHIDRLLLHTINVLFLILVFLIRLYCGTTVIVQEPLAQFFGETMHSQKLSCILNFVEKIPSCLGMTLSSQMTSDQ